MTSDIGKWCERKRPTVKAPTTYTPIQVNEPWELVGMDRIGKLSKTERGHEYICTVVDYLTKWAEAFPLQTKSAAVSDCIIKIFYRFGAPKRILTDQRREFKNEMNSISCKLLNIKRSRYPSEVPEELELSSIDVEGCVAKEEIAESMKRHEHISHIVKTNVKRASEKINQRKTGVPPVFSVGEKVLDKISEANKEKGES
ncbi:hypothetical protein AOXY_G37325 [Acipenser oxyrinchus oxyrinchus]|uniref:Integrase catalytic domain-containing protein n=1 Tax=Acipenser oxyrinchus oxyrinchus TaxID=40147 RepID=A0AAD8CE71_ACIOX|nr:hypothetical protein AOXY_G37325 [Acipenser oxyrinchus oxyrinchus]